MNHRQLGGGEGIEESGSFLSSSHSNIVSHKKPNLVKFPYTQQKKQLIRT